MPAPNIAFAEGSNAALAAGQVGLNPFHDYRAWELIHEARRIVERRTDAQPVQEQIDAIRAQLEASFQVWQAAGI